MAKTPQKGHELPGNDGSWFQDVVQSEPNGGRSAGSPNRTRATTTRKWVATELVTVPTDRPSLPPAKRHRARWIVLAVFVALLAGAVIATVLLDGLADRRALDVADRYRVVVIDVREGLPETQRILATATDPTSAPDDVGAAFEGSQVLAQPAEKMIALSKEPLPEQLPLFHSTLLAELGPLGERLSFMGVEAAAIARRIDDSIGYRTQLARLTPPVDLPNQAGPEELAALEKSLEEAFAASRDAAAALPDVRDLSDHRTGVLGYVASWESSVKSYLEAAHAGDVEKAVEIRKALRADWKALDRQLGRRLLALRRQIDEAILELDSQLQTTLTRLD